MSVTNYFLIGHLSVPSSWIAFIVAAVFAYCAVRVRYGKQHADVVSDSFFTVVIAWKLSVLLTDFGSVLRSPLSLIYFDGGTVGFYLGLLLIVGKILLDRRKGRLAADVLQALFTGAVVAQAVFQGMMVLLNEAEWVAQVVTVLLFVLLTLFFWIDSGKVADMRCQYALLFIAVHIFVASFQPYGLTGTPVVTTVFIGLFFAVVFSLEHRKGNRMEEHV